MGAISFHRIGLIAVFCVLLTYIYIAESQGTNNPNRQACLAACPTGDSPVCANNGVTYNNMCRFNCAKARNSRLRAVKSGTCNYVSLNDYRRGQQQG